MANTEKIRIYPDNKKIWDEICQATNYKSADLFKKVIESDVLKTREALKKFAEEELERKKRGVMRYGR